MRSRASTIFQKAMEIAADRRAAFVEEACAGDAGLQGHVEELLTQADATYSIVNAARLGNVSPKMHRSECIFADGDVIDARYRVIRFIAKGGMGEVYEVEDQDLKAKVALKTFTISPVFPARLADRFKREIQLSRQVTHPNVCRVYDLGHHSHPACGEILFLTMELLSGETLAARLEQHGAMTCDQALPLIRQMISALAAAHQLGIVHRDFKPGNVILIEESGKTLVKVTDFGLARSVRPEENSTRSFIEVAGTPPYMAPEQFRGEYSQQTDIYALGLTIFQMLTGKLPASRTSLFEGIPAKTVREIGPRWQRSIAKCVATDPAARVHRVGDVWKMLSGKDWVDDFHVVTNTPRYRRLTAVLAVTALVLLVATGLFWEGILRNPLRSVPDEKHIAVLPFQSIGNANAGDQAFSDGVIETLTSKLSQLERFQKSFWVVPSTDARQVKSLDDAYRRLNITLAVTGSIQHTASGVILTSNLVDAVNHKQLASRTIHVSSSDLEELQGRVWESVADMIDLQISPEAAQAVNRGETMLPGAYELYEQGVGYSQSYDEDSLDRAIGLFTRALEKDPNYALAYAGMGSAYASKYALTKDSEWIRKAIWSGQHALQLNDRLAEVHVTMGKIYRETGEWDKALSEFHQAIDEDPSSIDAAYFTGQIYETQGKLVEAEQALQSVVNRRPGYWAGYSGLGSFYYNHGDFSKAATQFKAMTELQPDNSVGYQNLGAVYMAMGRRDDAISTLKKGLALKETSAAWSNLGSAYMYLERYPEAAAAMKRATELDPHNDVLWRNLGDSYRQIPARSSDAVAAYAKALQAAQAELAVNPKSSEVLSGIALYDAHLGRKKEATDSISKALRLSAKNSDVLFTSALVYEIIGNRTQALSAIDEAVKAGYSIEDVEHEPELRALRSDSRYPVPHKVETSLNTSTK